MAHFFVEEEKLLSGTLGLNGINEDARAFLFNSVYMNHGHRFIWTSGLMISVMKADLPLLDTT